MIDVQLRPLIKQLRLSIKHEMQQKNSNITKHSFKYINCLCVKVHLKLWFHAGARVTFNRIGRVLHRRGLASCFEPQWNCQARRLFMESWKIGVKGLRGSRVWPSRASFLTTRRQFIKPLIPEGPYIYSCRCCLRGWSVPFSNVETIGISGVQ